MTRQNARMDAAPADDTAMLSEAEVPPQGWRTHAVRADAILGRTLRERGVEAGAVRSGTLLTLAWSQTDVELWHDGRALVSFPWRDVREVRRSRAAAGWWSWCPAVMVLVRGWSWMLVAPAHAPGGRLLPATFEEVGDLVSELRETWEAAQPPPPPRPVPRAKRVPAVGDDGVRWVDVELSAAVLARTRRRRDLALSEDERAAPVTEQWSPGELDGEVSCVLGEVYRVPQEPRSTVVEEAARIRAHLREHRPELADLALCEVLDDYCFENR